MRSSSFFGIKFFVIPPSATADPSGMYLFNELRRDMTRGGGGFTSDKPDKFRPTNVLPDTN